MTNNEQILATGRGAPRRCHQQLWNPHLLCGKKCSVQKVDSSDKVDKAPWGGCSGLGECLKQDVRFHYKPQVETVMWGRSRCVYFESGTNDLTDLLLCVPNNVERHCSQTFHYIPTVECDAVVKYDLPNDTFVLIACWPETQSSYDPPNWCISNDFWVL